MQLQNAFLLFHMLQRSLFVEVRVVGIDDGSVNYISKKKYTSSMIVSILKLLIK